MNLNSFKIHIIHFYKIIRNIHPAIWAGITGLILLGLWWYWKSKRKGKLVISVKNTDIPHSLFVIIKKGRDVPIEKLLEYKKEHLPLKKGMSVSKILKCRWHTALLVETGAENIFSPYRIDGKPCKYVFKIQNKKATEISIDLPISIVEVHLKLLQNGMPLQNAQVSCPDLAKAVSSDLKGNVVLKLSPGDHLLTILKDNWKEEKNINVPKTQKSIKIELKLKGTESFISSSPLEHKKDDSITWHAAKEKEKSGLYEEAMKLFEKAERYLDAARCAEKSGDREKAEYFMGLHLYEEGDLERAAAYLKTSGDAVLLAEIYERLGNNTEAAKWRATALRKEGKSKDAAKVMAMAGSMESAVACLVESGDWHGAAELAEKNGMYKDAAALWENCGEFRKAAKAYELAEDLLSAQHCFEKAKDFSSAAVAILKRNGIVEAVKYLLEKNLPKEAMELCNVQEKRMETDTNYIKAKAFALLAVGKRLESLSLFENILDTLNNKELENVIKICRETRNHTVAARATSILSSRNEGRKSTDYSLAAENRYEILEEIGRGAMGVVYKAIDRALNREIALKMLPSAKNQAEQSKTLIAEAKTAAKLNHPQIVKIFNTGFLGQDMFIAMELIKGISLEQVLKNKKNIPLRCFLNIIYQTCRALNFAHSHGIIHRDIKPANIIIEKNFSVKIADFGLAKIAYGGTVDRTSIRGTPLYISPEQIAGSNIDLRSDIYSLGITMYEMLAGRPPFSGGDIFIAHVKQSPPPLRSFNKNIPQVISDIIHKCLEKNRSKRPTSAADLYKKLIYAASQCSL